MKQKIIKWLLSQLAPETLLPKKARTIVEIAGVDNRRLALLPKKARTIVEAADALGVDDIIIKAVRKRKPK